MKAGKRDRKIIIRRPGAPTDDGYTEIPGEPANYATEYARIIWGTGREQREAAQEQASQTASFEVLANTLTRAISVKDKLCYPVTDEDPDAWPVWDIQAVADLDREGIRITATRAAA